VFDAQQNHKKHVEILPTCPPAYPHCFSWILGWDWTERNNGSLCFLILSLLAVLPFIFLFEPLLPCPRIKKGKKNNKKKIIITDNDHTRIGITRNLSLRYEGSVPSWLNCLTY
jgi:hypothetical protein